MLSAMPNQTHIPHDVVHAIESALAQESPQDSPRRAFSQLKMDLNSNKRAKTSGDFRRRHGYRLCPTKSAAFHGLLGVSFHKKGDYANAIFHYQHSLRRFCPFMKFGDMSYSLRDTPSMRAAAMREDIPLPARIVDAGGDEPYMRRLSSDCTQSTISSVDITSMDQNEESGSRHLNSSDSNAPDATFMCDIIDVDQQLSPKARCISIMFNLAVILYLDGNIDESQRLLYHLEDQRSEANDPELFIKISNNIGHLYMSKGKYQAAVDFLVSSLIEYWTLVGDTNQGGTVLARTLFGLAKAQYNIGSFDDSAENYQSAMALWYQNDYQNEVAADCHAAPAA